MKKITIVSAFIFLAIFTARSQQIIDPTEPRQVLRKSTCFLNSNFILALDAGFDAREIVIVISHLGKNEKNVMATRRLYNAKTFLELIAVKARSPERIITANGENSSGDGYLDFFVKGNLELRIYFPKNKDLFVQPCFEDPEQKPCTGENGKLFYPCRRGA